MDKFGLSDSTQKLLLDYFQSITELERVRIFGSRVKGNYKPHSDIDLVISGENLTLKLFFKISSELYELPTPYKFDVLWDKQITDKTLEEIINSTAKEFYSKY